MADTIVLIHGLWLTPRCWEDWIPRFEGRGYRVLAPSIGDADVVVAALEEPPILIGHSTGGALVQVLLDRGYGAAGVTLNSAPTAGVSRAPLAQLRSIFPALKSPAHRTREFGFSPEDSQYAFGTDAHERYLVPAPGRRIWDVLNEELHVGYGTRAPLLFISGRSDRIFPPSIQRANAGLYPHAHHLEVDGPHLLPVADGWEQVADHALRWAACRKSVKRRGPSHAPSPATSERSSTSAPK